MVQLLGSHLSIRMSILIPWEHMVLLLVGSLGTPRLTIGIICVLNLLMYLNRHQYHKSIILSIGSNSCQVVTHQVNSNIGCYHQNWSKCADNLTNI